MASHLDAQTFAVERQQRLAQLLSAHQIADSSHVRLHPVLIGGVGTQYTILRRDTGRMITTSAEGADAVRFFTRGLTIEETRMAVGGKYGCDPATVDMSGLLECLAYADFIADIGGHRFGAAVPLGVRLRAWASTTLAAGLVGLVIRYAPLPLALRLLYMRRYRRHAGSRAAVARNVRSAPALARSESGAMALARDHEDEAWRGRMDQLLLASLPAASLARWIRGYTRVSGVEHLNRARLDAAGTILCGMHAGSYYLIPFILGARAHAVIVLADLLEHGDEVVAWRLDELRQAGYDYGVSTVRGTPALRTLVRSLREGATVLVLCDSKHAPPASPIVDFLGRRMRVPPGVAWLQARTGAQLLPVVIERETRVCHLLTIEPPVRIECAATPDGATSSVMSAVFSRLEPYVLRRPAQWMLWKHFDAMVAETENQATETVAQDRCKPAFGD